MNSPFVFGLIFAVLSMIVGSIWYGPLFGKTWMRLNGVNPNDKKALEKMQKEAMPLYAIQFLLSLFQGWALLRFFLIGGYLLIGACVFVLPTLAGACMWTSETRKNAWARFLVQMGYQVILFVGYAIIVELWLTK